MANGDKKTPGQEPRPVGERGAIGERGKGRERPKSRDNRPSARARSNAPRTEEQGRKPNNEATKLGPGSGPNSGPGEERRGTNRSRGNAPRNESRRANPEAAKSGPGSEPNSGPGEERRGTNRSRGNAPRNESRQANPEAAKSGPGPGPNSGPGEERRGANRGRASNQRNEVRRASPEARKSPPPAESRRETHSPRTNDLLSDDLPLSEEPREPAGATFFRSVENYDQEKALESLSDLNVKLIKQANPTPGEWAYLTLTEEHCPPKEAERIKRAITLPADVYAVIVDSGFSLRVILTGTPMYERMLEFNFIAEASFDCWIQEEWMREEVYEDKYELLRYAPKLLQKYLEKDIVSNEELVHAPRPGGAMPPARTEW
jgi:hypothetical protein